LFHINFGYVDSFCLTIFSFDRYYSIESVCAEENKNLSSEHFARSSVFQQKTNSIEDRELIIKLSDRRVYFYQNDRFITSYPIASGKPGWETPTGSFQVTQMLKNPTWQHPLKETIVPPGSNNPLGDRWIAFWTDGKNFIGFHSTPNEQTVGTPASRGCIRMKNKDIRELFDRVAVGTTVVVEK
jgi:L,D-transpeptidase ErfK/SrfK